MVRACRPRAAATHPPTHTADVPRKKSCRKNVARAGGSQHTRSEDSCQNRCSELSEKAALDPVETLLRVTEIYASGPAAELRLAWP